MFSFSIVQKVVHPLSEYVKSVNKLRDISISLTCTGNKGVWVWRKRLGKYVSLEHPNNMKLKESQVRWIIQEKHKGLLTNAEIAEPMGVSVRWVQKLWARHKRGNPQEISHPAPMGRPQAGLPGRKEHSAVLSEKQNWHAGAVTLCKHIRAHIGINIPHGTIHKILRGRGPGQKTTKQIQTSQRTECHHDISQF